MRLFFIIALVVLSALTLTAADFAGIWKGSMETQMGNTEVVITVQQGTALAGQVKVAEFEGRIENAKVAGDNLSFEINIEHGKIAFEGTAAGDEMKLNVTGTQGNRHHLLDRRSVRGRRALHGRRVSDKGRA